MNAPSETAPSKGKMMIAAYRAERLSQRPALRESLHQSHIARRLARGHGHILPEPAVADPAEAPPPDTAPAAAPEPADPGSVFANLVSIAVAERQTATEPEADVCPEDACGEPVSVAADAPDDGNAAEPVDEASTPFDPPLAEIGFGPGMLIRLSQLGLNTTGDLAQTDADRLRAALGDISRLVDVEAWISSARKTASRKSVMG
jgi:hypothetical protein